MRLEPLFDQEMEQIKQEYEERIQQQSQTYEQRIQQELQQQNRTIIEGLLRFRFGSIDEELTAIIEPFAPLFLPEYLEIHISKYFFR